MTKKEEERITKFIGSNNWIFAKTYAKTAPHEYVIYDKLDEKTQKEYKWFIKQIEEKGIDEKFYQTTFRYLYFDGMKYWIHGTGEDDGGILNRDPAGNKYK